MASTSGTQSENDQVTNRDNEEAKSDGPESRGVKRAKKLPSKPAKKMTTAAKRCPIFC